jgi:hypothetical protein
MSYMTRLPGVPDSDDVNEGMAYFANTGPFGKTCETCAHRGYWRTKKRINPHGRVVSEKQVRSSGCQMFHRLSGRHGPRVDKSWGSCKYYEEKQSQTNH